MLNLAWGIARRGLRVDMVLAQATGPFLTAIPDGVRVVDLHAGRVLLSLPALVRYLRREQPQALLSAIAHANLVAIMAAMVAQAQTRIVISEHTTLSLHAANVKSLRARAIPFLIRTCYRWADKLVVVSNEAKDDLLRWARLQPNNVEVIYNPVITPTFYNMARAPLDHPWFAPGHPPVILAIGRLSTEKDFQTLLRAFAIVKQQMAVRLVILGEGEARADLATLVMHLGLMDDVEMPGFCPNPYAYLSKASIFVLSSRYEGLPTVLIEALALGVPVVSTDCPSGPREILENGRYGRLVPVADEQAMADAIIKTLKEPTLSDASLDISAFELGNATEKYLAALLGQ